MKAKREKTMSGLRANFESPRKRSSRTRPLHGNNTLLSEKVGYSPASKLIVPPISSEPFQQLSNVVSGVRDLDRRMKLIEVMSQGGKNLPASNDDAVGALQQLSDRESKKLEAEVEELERKVHTLNTKLLEISTKEGKTRRPAAVGLASRVCKVAVSFALNIILLSLVVFIAAVITNTYDNLFAYETPT